MASGMVVATVDQYTAIDNLLVVLLIEVETDVQMSILHYGVISKMHQCLIFA